MTPSSQPAVCASAHSTPISQASGEKTTPRMRSTLKASPPTTKPPSMTLARATRATKTISTAEMFSTTIRPSEVPLTMASTELSYFSAEL
ncbi:hypothetical protein D9M68_926050 [compost metagenome]